MTVYLHPKICNLCGGRVVLVDNDTIYGRKQGSGKCYMCKYCKAHVGTHIDRPYIALGILSDAPMRALKVKCHEAFDPLWRNEPTHYKRKKKRTELYRQLAKLMGIPEQDCHFGYFNRKQLEQAYEYVKMMGIEGERMTHNLKIRENFASDTDSVRRDIG